MSFLLFSILPCAFGANALLGFFTSEGEELPDDGEDLVHRGQRPGGGGEPSDLDCGREEACVRAVGRRGGREDQMTCSNYGLIMFDLPLCLLFALES